MRAAILGYPMLSERQWKICPYLEREGIDTHLLVPQKWPAIDHTDHPPEDADFETHYLDCIFEGHLARYTLRGIGSTIDRVDPDVLLTHGEPWTVVALHAQAVAERRNIPHVVFSWENLDRVPMMRVQRTLEQVELSRLNGVIAGSNAARERLRRRGFNSPITVSPQTGVDTETFRPNIDGSQTRDRFDIPQQSTVVLFAGRFSKEKGIDLLVETIPDTIDAHPRTHFVFIGGGPLESEIERKIEELDVGKHTTVISERQPYNEMPNIYSAADVFAYPSQTVEQWAEQFGYSVAEAMSCGVPVVTTRCGSLPTVVGDTGVVCREDSVSDLREALVRLVTDERLRKERGKQARERVESRFGLESVARDHVKALRLAVDGGKHGDE